MVKSVIAVVRGLRFNILCPTIWEVLRCKVNEEMEGVMKKELSFNKGWADRLSYDLDCCLG